jgi:hypothetical protein
MNKIIIVSIAKGISKVINAKNGTNYGTLDDKTYAITYFKLSKIRRPSLIPSTIALKSSFNN